MTTVPQEEALVFDESKYCLICKLYGLGLILNLSHVRAVPKKLVCLSESLFQTNNELTLSEQFWTKNPKAESKSSTHLAVGFAVNLLERLTVLF
jgi:hypothetical protein